MAGDAPPAGAGRTLRARLAPGRAAFNRGEFFAAHELWEDVWRDPAVGEHRTFVQGLIQIAAGLHHLQNGRPHPAARVLARGADKVATGATRLATTRLLRDVRRLVAALEEGGAGEVKVNRVRF